jgi:curved DNA-binding protein
MAAAAVAEVEGVLKNYYEILGVEKTADVEEVRLQYRKLAMEYHPDHNPDNPEAEEKFKEIAEAYGVLTDPAKRREYDVFVARGGTRPNHQQGGFSYSQEDILRDLFRDPQFQQMFQGLMREFQRSGLRAGPHFLKRSFFGGKGGFFIGGLFLFGSLAGPALLRGGKKALPGGKSILRTLGGSIGNLLTKNQAEKKDVAGQDLDITYQTPLSHEELRLGKSTQVVFDGENGREVLKVKISPGSRYGQKLRLKGKGKHGPQGRGDLFLQLCEK